MFIGVLKDNRVPKGLRKKDMRVKVKVDEEARRHGRVSSCITCPGSYAIGKLLKPQYYCVMGGLNTANLKIGQEFVIKSRASALDNWYGKIPREFRKWQNLGCDIEDKEETGTIRGGITLPDIEFTVDIPKKYLKETKNEVTSN